jgi:hypothetical protein
LRPGERRRGRPACGRLAAVPTCCNGKWQTPDVDLGRHPEDFGGREPGYPKNGKAYMQFCLVSMEDESPPASGYRRLTVTGAGGGHD